MRPCHFFPHREGVFFRTLPKDKCAISVQKSALTCNQSTPVRNLNEVILGRKVNTSEKLISPAYWYFMLDDQTKRNQLSLSEFKVISMVVSIRTLSVQTMAKTLQENGENLILTAVLPLPQAMSLFPTSTAQWKGIADGRTLTPEFSLASIMAYFVTRKV